TRACRSPGNGDLWVIFGAPLNNSARPLNATAVGDPGRRRGTRPKGLPGSHTHPDVPSAAAPSRREVMLAAEVRAGVSLVIASPVLRRLLPAFAVSAAGGRMTPLGLHQLPWPASPPVACCMRPTQPCPPPCSSGKAPATALPVVAAHGALTMLATRFLPLSAVRQRYGRMACHPRANRTWS